MLKDEDCTNKGYSEFKIGFTIGELGHKILKLDSDIIEIEDIQ